MNIIKILQCKTHKTTIIQEHKTNNFNSELAWINVHSANKICIFKCNYSSSILFNINTQRCFISGFLTVEIRCG